MIPLLALLLLAPFPALPADEPDWPDDLEERIRAVNDGELQILIRAPERPVHHHINRIRVDERSLDTGWVGLTQCHEHLDPVPDLEIVYHPERIRGLRILESSNVAEAVVQGPSVQLRDVQPGARLCIRAESRALQRLPDGCRELRNGPYMRRFLDGYYPMRVSLDVEYPAHLKVAMVDPPAQPGVQLRDTPGALKLSAVFEGRLHTRVLLCPDAK